MNGLTVVENAAIVEQRIVNADLFSRWNFIYRRKPQDRRDLQQEH